MGRIEDKSREYRLGWFTLINEDLWMYDQIIRMSENTHLKVKEGNLDQC